MDVVKILRQLKIGRPHAAANKAVQHLAADAARGLAILLIQISQVDEAVVAAFDDELPAVIFHVAGATGLAQLGHYEPRELVAAGRAEQKVEPGHGGSPGRQLRLYRMGRGRANGRVAGASCSRLSAAGSHRYRFRKNCSAWRTSASGLSLSRRATVM